MKNDSSAELSVHRAGSWLATVQLGRYRVVALRLKQLRI